MWMAAIVTPIQIFAGDEHGRNTLAHQPVKVLAMEPRSSADAQRVMGKLGQLLEVADAQRIWRAIDAGVSAVAQSLPPGARQLRVYYEVSAGGYAAGTGSFIGEMMARLGVQNVVAPSMGPFPRVNPEYVVRANPQVIMVGQRSAPQST